MDWIQFTTLFVSVVGLFVWNRTESRADLRHLDAKIDAIRELIREIHRESLQERREFHSRLCEIEAKRRN